MSDNDLIEGIKISMEKLLSNDSYLLVKNLSERSITHRLAVYLNQFFPYYDVDCEYNGAADREGERKKIYLLQEQMFQLGFLKIAENQFEDELLERLFLYLT